MDLGPHAAFIWASYAVVGGIVALLIAWAVLDGRRQSAALEDATRRGSGRRARSGREADPA